MASPFAIMVVTNFELFPNHFSGNISRVTEELLVGPVKVTVDLVNKSISESLQNNVAISSFG